MGRWEREGLIGAGEERECWEGERRQNWNSVKMDWEFGIRLIGNSLVINFTSTFS